MVNPEIVLRGEEMRLHEEGCLSIPDVTAEIERPARTRVRFIDREGKRGEIELEGIWSTLVQHEIDHLNGVLVHRPSVAAEARHDRQEAHQDEARRRALAVSYATDGHPAARSQRASAPS